MAPLRNWSKWNEGTKLALLGTVLIVIANFMAYRTVQIWHAERAWMEIKTYSLFDPIYNGFWGLAPLLLAVFFWILLFHNMPLYHKSANGWRRMNPVIVLPISLYYMVAYLLDGLQTSGPTLNVTLTTEAGNTLLILGFLMVSIGAVIDYKKTAGMVPGDEGTIGPKKKKKPAKIAVVEAVPVQMLACPKCTHEFDLLANRDGTGIVKCPKCGMQGHMN